MPVYSVSLTFATVVPVSVGMLEGAAAIGGASSGDGHRLETMLTVESAGPAEAIGEAIRVLPIAGEVVAAEAVSEAEADLRLEGPPFPALAGVAEVAELLGISRQRLHTLRERADFPGPVAVLASGPIWRKEDLSTFASGWNRKAGRPRLSA